MKLPELKPLYWDKKKNTLKLLDQKILPNTESWVDCKSADDAAEHIRIMTVRGAPAIGIAAAYAMALAKLQNSNLKQTLKTLGATRPTAVNLFWALKKCEALVNSDASFEEFLTLAEKIHDEDIQGNKRMGEAGAAHVKDGMNILTHCNAGLLATGGIGTALGVIYTAHAQGKKIHVYVDETRPRLQGARLTAWELSQAGIAHTLICDNMAASLMAKKKIDFCVTGADRIAANGDSANKIGTYSVAVNANHHGIPFHIAAPSSTFDLSIKTGEQIPIETRAIGEVVDWGNEKTAPIKTPVYNPGFDVTPVKLIRSIFTDFGEIAPLTPEKIKGVIAQGCDNP